VLALFTGLFLLSALLAYRALARLVHRSEPAFAATLGELREDLVRLKAASRHAKAPD